jgi:hypothetical protein
VKSLAQSLPEVRETRPHRALETVKATPPYERIQLSDPAVEAKFIATLAKIMKPAAEATSITTLKDARGLIQQALTDHKEWQRPGFGPDEITPTMLKVVQAQEQ